MLRVHQETRSKVVAHVLGGEGQYGDREENTVEREGHSSCEEGGAAVKKGVRESSCAKEACVRSCSHDCSKRSAAPMDG